MKKIQQPAWYEGVMLTQQHFQQWQQYIRYDQHHYWQQNTCIWGLTRLEVDESALENAHFKVLACEAVFNDGRTIHYEDQYHQSLDCRLDDCREDVVPVYLAWPFQQMAKGLTGYPDKSDTYGYYVQYESVKDHYDPDREREVAFVYPNLYLTAGAKPENATYLQIAEVVRMPSGEWQLSSTFIPSCLNLSVSSALLGRLDNIIQFLEGKIRFIRDKQHDIGDYIQFIQSDFAYFLLNSVMSRYLPLLQHYVDVTTIHPEKVYLTLQQLLSELGVFDASQTLSAYTPYDHTDLGGLFQRLESNIKQLVSQALPINMQKITLYKTSEAIRETAELDEKLLHQHEFYLSVQLNLDDLNWVKRFMEQVKIASSQDLGSLVGSALRGVPLKHIQRPPNYLPVKTGCEYFALDMNSQFGKGVIEHKKMAIFLSKEFMQADVELIAARSQ